MRCDGTCAGCVRREQAERIEALEAKCDMLAASLKKADAEVERVTAERDEARALAAREKEWATAFRGDAAKLLAERDRLLAVLADTPENVDAVARFFDRWYSKSPPWTEPDVAARALLAHLGAKAGLS